MKTSMTTSRRGFLQGVAALAAMRTAAAQPAQGPQLLYIASYSSPQGPEGSKGNGQGIYLFEMDRASGKLTSRVVFSNPSNPSWLAFNPSRTCLYSANETATFRGAASGSVTGYRVDRASGRLLPLNTESSGGAGPCYLSVHPSGRFAFTANYAGGTVAVLPVRANGELGAPSDIKAGSGPTGSTHAASGPNGSFAISGHDRPHGHMILPDPSGKWVLSTDLGMDEIHIWDFDAQKGVLNPRPETTVKLPSGDGPRHFAFHPNGRRMYCLGEESSTLVAFDFDPAEGRLHSRQTLSTLPKGFAGTDFTSEVAVSADGRFVYAANRLHDSIAWFAIGADGALTLSGEEWTRGDYPRSFTIDPSGRFLYSCNQRADAVTCFRVNQQTGALTFTGEYTPVGTPAMVLFL